MKNQKKARVKIKTLKHQTELIQCTAKYPALVAGYGSGKTEAGIFWSLNKMRKYGKKTKKQHKKRYVLAIYEPTFDLIKLILFPRFEQILRSYGLKYVLNKSDKVLYIDHFNTTIIFRSMDNPERIVGYETHDFWIDELDTLKKNKANAVFDSITDRNRATKSDGDINTGIVTTTPEGYKFVYEKWELAKDKQKFKLIRGSSTNNPYLKKDYIDDLYDKYDEQAVKAFVHGYFVNLNSSNVYYSFNRVDNNTNLEISDFSEREILHVGMDFNVEKMAAVIGVNEDEDNEVYILEEIKNVLDTPSMIEVLKEKYPNRILRIYPDASGNNRKSNNASVSDLSLLRKEKNFQVSTKKKNPFIRDRVLSVNGLLKNGKGKIRLYINIKNCKELTRNLEQQTYDENTGQPDKKNGMDHIVDALGYLVYRLYPVRRLIKEDDK